MLQTCRQQEPLAREWLQLCRSQACLSVENELEQLGAEVISHGDEPHIWHTTQAAHLSSNKSELIGLCMDDYESSL